MEIRFRVWNNRLGVGLGLGNNRGTIENNGEECFDGNTGHGSLVKANG